MRLHLAGVAGLASGPPHARHALSPDDKFGSITNASTPYSPVAPRLPERPLKPMRARPGQNMTWALVLDMNLRTAAFEWLILDCKQRV